MRKWTGRILVGFSTLMLILSAGMWVRSYFATDFCSWTHIDLPTGDSRVISILSDGGGVQFVNQQNSAYFAPNAPNIWSAGWSFGYTNLRNIPPAPGRARRPTIGPQFRLSIHEKVTTPNFASTGAIAAPLMITTDIVAFPYWLATLLSAAVSFWLWRRLWKQSKIQQGCCKQCGYDLRATPERCPECGRATAEAEPAGAK
jgi:hypothetical protein